jgi:hypothetical protein
MTNAVAASHAACKRSKGSENARSSLLERRATGEREKEKTRGFGGWAGTFAGCFLGLGVVLFVTPGMRSDE